MGRPAKNGLDYFPLDIDFPEDEKIRYATAAYGLNAEAIIIRLLCRIYKNNGFIKWDEDAEILFAASLGRKITRVKIHGIIQELLKRSFFDKKMFEKHAVLTSRGIQRRMNNIANQLHRKSTIPEYYLISSEETTGRLPVNTEKSAQIKRKEIKGNKIKGNKTREQPESAEETTGDDLKNISLNSQKHFYDCDPKQAAAEILKRLA
jgi:hypothetical protein